MNFEIIDNLFQVFVMFVSALISYIAAVKLSQRSARCSRMFMTLAFGYTSFMLGTLFFVLHIIILSYNAKIFYVSEISWTAAHMFFLSLAMMRERGHEKESRTIFAWIPVGIAVCIVAAFVILYGPSVMGGLFSVTVTALAYKAARGVHRAALTGASMRLDITFLAAAVLQSLVYIVSVFTHDYTRFNLYFAVDITFTLTMASFAGALYKEAVSEYEEGSEEQ